MARGSLRIYLGASPGVGKTYKMLGEGVRRDDRGADVVIGLVETHGRAQTADQLRDLEIMPRREIPYRDTVLYEMDVDAILLRRPEIVLVDEYAHTNAPGSRNEKRWQDVERLLDAGIDVISTLNIQHLESLNDVITRITGIVQRETVPDDIVRRADQLELVDMAPEAIRRRMAHGNIYPAERVDAALANYFRPGNLGALRELALLWVADRVEESLTSYLDAHGISEAWETRERVVVGMTGFPGGEAVIRRAARMAGRVGGELIALHVAVDDGLSQQDDAALTGQRKLVTELGGTVHDVVASDTAEAMAAFARREKATQLVLGASLRSRWHELLHGSFVARVTRLAPDVDVHVIARTGDSGYVAARTAPQTMVRRRTTIGWLLIALGLPILVVITMPFRESIDLSTELLLALVAVLAIAGVGGLLIGVVAAVVASVLLNWFYVRPYGTLTIGRSENLVSLVVFIAVAVAVGALVDIASRRSLEARRARLEAEALVRSTTSLAFDPEPVQRLVEQIRSTFDLAGVRLSAAGGTLPAIATDGDVDSQPTVTLSLTSGLGPLARKDMSDPTRTLELFGRALSADDERLLRALADQLALALDNQTLAADADEAASLANVDAVRTAMLRAVSHDLRTPLASIKAMVSGLRDPSVCWSPDELAEALLTVDEETDRLNQLVGNLLDASRLQIGTLAISLQPAHVSDIVNSALHSTNIPSERVRVDVPTEIASVRCDAALLERSLANVMANAERFSPMNVPFRVEGAQIGEKVHIRVVDNGIGIAGPQRDQVMQPFQRLGDTPVGDGVGLGLSIASGFITAMGGTLALDDTPGGGLTVTIVLPCEPDRTTEPRCAP
jgi:two-component system, OmpR family, sensor histidine kinase KdpD